MLKTVVLLNIFVETVTFFKDSLMITNVKRTVFIYHTLLCLFYQLNVSLENKIMYFNCTDLKLLNGYKCIPQPSESTTNWINCVHHARSFLSSFPQRTYAQINKWCFHKHQRSLTAGHVFACVQSSSLIVPVAHRDKYGLERLCYQIHRSCVSFSQLSLLMY